MTRIAVFSDVHGNFDALRAVLDLIEKEQVDQTIFIGDIFQRGNQEIECLEYLRNSDILCVKGNCELYLDQGVDIDPDMEYLRDYYDTMRAGLTAEQRAFIHELPLYYERMVNGHKLLFCHFLFRDIEAAYPLRDLTNQPLLFLKLPNRSHINMFHSSPRRFMSRICLHQEHESLSADRIAG